MAAQNKIRTMSYNIHSGVGMDGRYDLERLASDIREAGADLVGLQEADVHWGSRSGNENSVEKLAAMLGMHAFFAPIYDMEPETEGQPRKQFGVALLSKYPLIATVNRSMTRLSTQHPGSAPEPKPGFLDALLDVDGREVSVLVAHLDYRSDPAVRRIQVQEALDVLERLDRPVILLGDFNARPDAPELEPLFRKLTDTWSVNGSDPGYTFPADVPDRKIDYILISGEMQAVSSKAVPSEASDHWPIWADLRFIADS